MLASPVRRLRGWAQGRSWGLSRGQALCWDSWVQWVVDQAMWSRQAGALSLPGARPAPFFPLRHTSPNP